MSGYERVILLTDLRLTFNSFELNKLEGLIDFNGEHWNNWKNFNFIKIKLYSVHEKTQLFLVLNNFILTM